MDEHENTRLIRKAYESFGVGDVPSFLSSLDPDIEWQVPAMENVPFAGTWRGHAGVRQFLSTLAETQEVVEFSPEQFIAQGNTVIVLGRFLMRVRSTGRESASDWAHVWTIADGRVTRFREYVDTATVSGAHSPAPSRSVDAARSS